MLKHAVRPSVCVINSCIYLPLGVRINLNFLRNYTAILILAYSKKNQIERITTVQVCVSIKRRIWIESYLINKKHIPFLHNWCQSVQTQIMMHTAQCRDFIDLIVIVNDRFA